MERYLRLNVENRVLERYRKINKIPFSLREIIPIKNIQNFQILDDSQEIVKKEAYIKFTYNDEEHLY